MHLHVLELGRFPGGGHPIPGYLIALDDGRHALVDTGFRTPRPGTEHYAVAAHLAATGFGDEDATYLLGTDGRSLLVAELARVGLAPDDVDLVVLTHLDHDHNGNHDLFPRAEVVVQRAALDAARTEPDQRSWPVRASVGWVRWRLLDGDATLAPGLDVVVTSGHVPTPERADTPAGRHRPDHRGRRLRFRGLPSGPRPAPLRRGPRGSSCQHAASPRACRATPRPRDPLRARP